MSLYSGCGNTFLLIDNRNQALTEPTAEECAHADGVIFLENSTTADVKMRIFNCDGKETEMCGNGIRCFVRFLEDLRDPRRSFKIETMERMLTAHNHGDMIAIEMGNPTDIKWSETLEVEGKNYIFHYLNTGVPHAVTFTHLSSDLDLSDIGPKIRYHPHYQPCGTNVNFAQIEDDETITLRTYERGVEAETEACGTGACATALAASKVYGIKSPIAIRTKSKEILYISFNMTAEDFSGVTLTGPATLV